MSDVIAFTIKYDKVVDQLIFPCVLAHNGIILKANALIDTGALASYISSDLSMILNPVKTGQETKVITTQFDGVYPIVMVEYLGVPKNTIFDKCKFIVKPFASDNFNLILGMDFLNKGDFAISRINNCTTVTIHRPSISAIECQNIVDEKDIPQLIKMMRNLPINTIRIDN